MYFCDGLLLFPMASLGWQGTEKSQYCVNCYCVKLLLYFATLRDDTLRARSFFQEIMREGSEKERDCSISRINTYRVGVQSEKNFFTQELGIDLDYVSRVFMVKQMEYHREMFTKLERVYHQCWPEEQPQGRK